MNQSGKILLLLVTGIFLVGSTVSAAPGKHAQGMRSGGKFVAIADDCKYTRKVDPGGYKEDLKCKAGHPLRFAGNGPPPWAPAHGYRRNHYRDYGLAAMPIDIGAGRCNREIIGQILGGAVGGLAGSEIGDGTGRLIAVAAGTLAGVIIGGEIGRSMDRADQLCIDQTLEHAPDGGRIIWNDEATQYSVTPRETFQDNDGRYCREYTMDVIIQGQTEQAYGKACRQQDGSWQMVRTD